MNVESLHLTVLCGLADEFLDDLNELDDVDEGRAPKRRRGEEPADPVSAENGEGDADEEEECRQVRLMVGMDDTLDFEVRQLLDWLTYPLRFTSTLCYPNYLK